MRTPSKSRLGITALKMQKILDRALTLLNQATVFSFVLACQAEKPTSSKEIWRTTLAAVCSTAPWHVQAGKGTVLLELHSLQGCPINFICNSELKHTHTHSLKSHQPKADAHCLSWAGYLSA